MTCPNCPPRAIDELTRYIDLPWARPGQLPLFVSAHGRALLEWAERLPEGRSFIYLRNAGPGQFSVGEALRRFGWNEEEWDEIRRELHRANLLGELSWGVWCVTALARQTVLADFVRDPRSRPSALALGAA